MTRLMTVKDLKIKPGTVVIDRADLNVPIKKGAVGRQLVASAARIEAACPTIQELRAMQARVVVISHLGKPKGTVKAALTLAPVAEVLADKLGVPVSFCYERYGATVDAAVGRMKEGEVLLLENTRFEPQEEDGDVAMAQALVRATKAGAFVLDGFSVAHRPHALVTGLAEVMKEQGLPAVAGLLVGAEFEGYSKVLNPETPAVAVMGGAKVTDKIETVDALTNRTSAVFIGGAMLYYFLRAKGVVDESMPDPLGLAPEETGKNIAAANTALGHDLSNRIHLPGVNQLVMDGPVFRDVVGLGAMIDAVGARTAFWNGPVGLIEKEQYRAGTLEVVAALSKIPNVVVGGGDTESVRNFAELPGYVSMAGGAGLELLAFGHLPGIDALSLVQE